MNGNKAKHHKRGKRGLKTKTKDGEAEVFVLPPDLLQKLGIHLGNVRPNEGSPKELASTSEYLQIFKAIDEPYLNFKPKAVKFFLSSWLLCFPYQIKEIVGTSVYKLASIISSFIY